MDFLNFYLGFTGDAGWGRHAARRGRCVDGRRRCGWTLN